MLIQKSESKAGLHVYPCVAILAPTQLHSESSLQIHSQNVEASLNVLATRARGCLCLRRRGDIRSNVGGNIYCLPTSSITFTLACNAFRIFFPLKEEQSDSTQSQVTAPALDLDVGKAPAAPAAELLVAPGVTNIATKATVIGVFIGSCTHLSEQQ